MAVQQVVSETPTSFLNHLQSVGAQGKSLGSAEGGQGCVLLLQPGWCRDRAGGH